MGNCGMCLRSAAHGRRRAQQWRQRNGWRLRSLRRKPSAQHRSEGEISLRLWMVGQCGGDRLALIGTLADFWIQRDFTQKRKLLFLRFTQHALLAENIAAVAGDG